MSILGDLLGGVRQVLLLEQRVNRMAVDLEKLNAAHAETRERLIRVEVIIEEARRAERRYLPGE